MGYDNLSNLRAVPTARELTNSTAVRNAKQFSKFIHDIRFGSSFSISLEMHIYDICNYLGVSGSNKKFEPCNRALSPSPSHEKSRSLNNCNRAGSIGHGNGNAITLKHDQNKQMGSI